ncbi:MAG: COR domain-containing protein, partial [Alphaproteobacteria bacterium]
VDLTPLLALNQLRELNCSGCSLCDAMPELWALPALQKVVLYEATLPGVPAEVLSPNDYTSCLKNLRAHFADLCEDGIELTDVKLMYLGTGRVGKTQIARRLRGKDYNDSVASTHGVIVSTAPLSMPPDDIATLKIWDFGGQDIYHGTHALFLKTRAVFLLAWEPGAESVQYHEHDGFTFRNEPLGYWLAYVRHFSGEDAPVLIAQTQCDRPEQEVLHPPLPEEALNAFPYKKVLHYSAKENRGRAALDEALVDAVRWLRKRQGVALIGKGRAAVKDKLEKLYARGKRLITQAEYLKLCEKAGNISSPPALLDYLHNTGEVFYREGLFGDRIILDQSWALNAVYAVFDRDSKAFKNIERAGGRFRRSELAEWVWKQFGEDEQKLFISFMEQCDICFTHRKGDDRIEAEYIAPDLLPPRDDPVITAQLRDKWSDGPCNAEATLEYELLPPGLMRSLIAKVGAEAGLAAEYWRDGFYFYDEETSSRALVEQSLSSEWAGEIHVQTRDGQAEALLQRVLEFIDDRHDALGAQASDRCVTAHKPDSEMRA